MVGVGVGTGVVCWATAAAAAVARFTADDPRAEAVCGLCLRHMNGREACVHICGNTCRLH